MKKERNTVYVQGMDFKLRNLSNVYNHVCNIWQQTGQSNFLERLFFIIPSMLLVLALLQLEVFPPCLGFFFLLICFHFRKCNQLRLLLYVVLSKSFSLLG